MNFDKAKLQARQQRFLRDPLPVRLGNLASNLARLKAFAQRPELSEAAQRVVYESKHFSEWAARDADLATQAELRALQRQLARWQCGWAALWPDAQQRAALSDTADDWSQRLLACSGLLTTN
ncbi:MAG: hypothetical protein HYR56_07125 [Acidobacteria bacterium]|nr:hypothetical protein [Acidobacteriota bacterium]MBI3427975.1 hypothetical protein [Acidobacteriota bacterium]